MALISRWSESRWGKLWFIFSDLIKFIAGELNFSFNGHFAWVKRKTTRKSFWSRRKNLAAQVTEKPWKSKWTWTTVKATTADNDQFINIWFSELQRNHIYRPEGKSKSSNKLTDLNALSGKYFITTLKLLISAGGCRLMKMLHRPTCHMHHDYSNSAV